MRCSICGSENIRLHQTDDTIEIECLTCHGVPVATDESSQLHPRHLGGPDDDHYARLGEYQPLEVVASWAEHWPSRYTYPLGECIYMVGRFSGKSQGSIEQSIRDMRKLAFLANWIADDLERIGARKS